jgi:hypothetical protein
MIRILTYYLLVCYLFCGCTKKNVEQPFDLAKNYCDCINNAIANHKDSLIDMEDCEREVLDKSRFMQIKAFYDRDPLLAGDTYSYATLDSAKDFCDKVFRSFDTMCYQKIDTKRFKKKPHTF